MKALELFDALVSRGQLQMDTVSRGQLRAAIIESELAAMDSVAEAERRNRRRLADKDRQRKSRASHADRKRTPTILILDTDSDSKKERKRQPMQKNATGDLFGTILPAVMDDWPDDYETQFWDRWPSHPRKHSQKQVCDKLARIRHDGGIKIGKKFVRVTWAMVWGGLNAYLDSKPEHKFIPCPLVWVNQARWTATCSPANDVAPAPTRGFGAVAFGRR